MAMQRRRFCKTCNAHRLFVRHSSISTGMGCLLTILTGGIFLLVWLIFAILDAFKPYRCQQCGQSNWM